jgi:UDP-3-O-[3-hydroxymyristoyl] glucosamine N-acyltransferase
MEFSAGQIAALLQGSVEGDAETVVNNLSPIEAGAPKTLTFLANPAYTPHIYSTKASIAIVANSFKAEQALPKGLTLVRVEDPRLAFSTLMQSYAQMMKPAPGVHPTAVVHSEATLAPSASIGAHAVIERGAVIEDNAQIGSLSFIGSDVRIGHSSVLHERVHIGPRCQVGAECIIQPGAIIGGDGFGFAPNRENEYQKVVHLGNVVLEDHVEIGAGTTIDRATLGSTVIRKGVKLDNLIQVAHNVEIGENTVIAAQTGIAGSTKIGKNCMIGGQVGIIGHITIADGVKIAAQSGIGGSIKEVGAIVQGSPALPIGDFKRSYVHFRKLHEMAQSIEQIKDTKPKTDIHG